jgi:putative endonuclease
VTYVGATLNLVRRIAQHRAGRSAFTRKYKVNRLVHVECILGRDSAFAREWQIKGWSDARKRALIASLNPTWDDLDPELFHRKRAL